MRRPVSWMGLSTRGPRSSDPAKGGVIESRRVDGNSETCLFEPRVEKDGRHQEHPPPQPGEQQYGLKRHRGRWVVGLQSVEHLTLDLGAFGPRKVQAIGHVSLVVDALRAQPHRKNLHPQEQAGEGQHEDVAAGVVAADPGATDGLARGPRRHSLVRSAQASGDDEDAIDEGRAEEPLGRAVPPSRDEAVPHQALHPARRQEVDGATVGEEERQEGRRGPEPAGLDEDGVEDVGLVREERGRRVRRVRSHVGIVRRRSRRRVQRRVDRAQQKRHRIDREQERFQ